jgi:hypothetical protein
MMMKLNKYIHECIKDATAPAWYNAKDNRVEYMYS